MVLYRFLIGPLVCALVCAFVCAFVFASGCYQVKAAKLGQVETVPTCRSLAYGAKPLELDLYSSSTENLSNVNPSNKNQETALPGPDLIVCAHGGAWSRGDKADRLYGANLAKALLSPRHDYASINYRLAPRYKYPAQIEDYNRAIDFLLKLDRYRKSKLVLFGHSAGAQIVAAWILSPQAKARLSQSRIKAIVLIDPPALEISRMTKELKAAFGENARASKLSLLSKVQNLPQEDRAQLPPLTMVLSSDWRGKREQQSRTFFTLWHRNTNRKDTLIKVPENHVTVISALQAKKYELFEYD
ncbi:MAG: alpha/beta hydrolase [Candidatus Obscuribacterales bacterium]|nr:alpha/beta hydrolase [Candidatus Obscuribacterales bacterium]